jgi:polar amino acid transport system substrate-binding protein
MEDTTMKKMTALLLCLALTLTMSACSKAKAPAAEDTSAEQSIEEVEEFVVPEGYEVKAAFAEDNAPFSYVDKSGNLVGINVDIAQAICDKNNWKLNAKAIPWSNWTQELESGDSDCVWGSVSYSESAQNEALWAAYGSIYVDAVVKDESEYMKLGDLKGKRIEVEPVAAFVLEGENATELGKQLAADAAEIVPVSDAQTAYQDLAAGKCDAVVVSGGADDQVDFEAFEDAFRSVYDVDIYGLPEEEEDSSELDFETIDSNGLCDLDLGAAFADESDLFYALADTMESMLSSGELSAIMETWKEKDNGAYADAIASCTLYQMEEYDPDMMGDESLDWEDLEDLEDLELEDGSASALPEDVDITAEDEDESVIVVD